LKKYGIIIDTKKQIEKEDEENSYILSLEKLSEYLSMPVYNLKVIDELLTDKKQIIFYGPPGTSKTFVAKKFAEYFVNGKKENIEIVQFHPSYSYEDFVEILISSFIVAISK
jgi:SpoVK/Ycf46/Vps4 family AAA+-type ATPase